MFFFESFGQLSKALSDILIKDSGNSTFLSEVQFKNAFEPISLTFLGIIILFKFTQPLHISIGIRVRDAGS